MTRLIDADELKKTFEETICIEPVPYAFIKQIIDDAPTVEKRPHGEWETVYHTYPFVDENVRYWKFDIVKCNLCGTVREGRVNFCSSCGAKMEVNQNDT